MFHRSPSSSPNHDNVIQEDNNNEEEHMNPPFKGIRKNTPKDHDLLGMDCDNVTVATVGTTVTYSTYSTHPEDETSLRSAAAASERDDYHFWKRADLCIQTPPIFYTPEPDTAVFPKEQLTSVVARLLSVFRSLSLHVTYQRGDDHATAAASCRTLDGVGFHVLIWDCQTRGGSGAYLQLELRHTSGCGMRFRQNLYADAILAAVPECEATGANALPVTPPPQQGDPLCFDFIERDEEVRLMDALWKRCHLRTTESEMRDQFFLRLDALLCSPRLDAVAEGLHRLLDATHPQKAGFHSAQSVATQLLLSSSPSKCSTIVFYLAFGECWPSFVEMVSSHDLRLHPSMLQQYSYLAWTIVAQSVSFLPDADAVAQFTQHIRDVLRLDGGASLYSVLLRTAQKAREQPHLAYCATHILAQLHILVEEQEDLPPVEDVATAQHYGLEQARKRWATVQIR